MNGGLTRVEARQKVVAELQAERDRQQQTADSRRSLTAGERRVLGLGDRDEVLDFVVLDEKTIECVFGWVFFWQAVDPLASSDEPVVLAGGGPYAVNRKGDLFMLMSAQPTEDQIESFRRCGDPFAELPAQWPGNSVVPEG